jgi:hypothetical protein
MRKQCDEKYCNCGRKIDTRAIDLLDYTNLSEVFSLVIGKMPPCKQKTCKKWAALIAMDSVRIIREIKSQTLYSPLLSNSWFGILRMKTRKKGGLYFIV